jgi:chemotaxis response regulator CheB
MANRDVVAIGTSAGGVEALQFPARAFPRDLPASILIVIHLSGQFHSALDVILNQAGPLLVSFAKDGERLERSRTYIAPLERHRLLEGDRLQLGHGPPENHVRPAIDVMFRSIALCCGARAIGAILTGTLGDGASGLKTLKQCGGITVVQDPDDAAFPDADGSVAAVATGRGAGPLRHAHVVGETRSRARRRARSGSGGDRARSGDCKRRKFSRAQDGSGASRGWGASTPP